ncbi:MAG: CHAT domain-containing protein, partial [Planctomycetota bacterium]|nr:CHAT domain-containing protein [Planctomycetota bacterium]
EGQGDPVRAFESVHRSREAAARAGDRAGEARAWSSLGRLYHIHARDPGKAVAALEKAVTALEGLDDKSRLAHTLIELGMALRRTGQLERAAAAHDRAYKLLDAMRDKPGMAVVLSGLGGLCIRRGEYARALTCLEEARLLMQALGNPKGEAAVLAQLGELYTLLSDAERAEQCFASSFSIAEEMGAQRPLVGPAERSGEEATPPESDGSHAQLLERALSCVPNGCDGDACASILRRLGSLHMLEGEFGTTLGRHEAALEAAERTGDPLQVTAALVDLAGMHRAMGTLKGALEVDQRAVELAQATGSYEALARALWSRATTRLQLGEPSLAVQDARRAVREATFVYTKLSEFDGARVGDLWRGLFETGVEAAMRLGSVSDAAWFLEAGRSGMLLTSLGGREALWSHVVPPALRREEALARAAEEEALAGYRKAYAQRRLVEMRARRRELQDARTQVARVLARTRTEARGAANLVCPAPDTLATLQSRLARDEALVLYAVLPRRVLALVATPTEARIVKLGFRRGLERKLAGLDFASRGDDTRGAVASLRAQLVAPLELPAAVRRVLVSPMGGLGLVPPALLFPKHEIAYVPSGTTYGLLLEERSLRGRGVLAVGDPDYSGLRRWAPLPGTRAEVEAVGTVRLVGRDANEPGFVRALGLRPRWRAVHLACHGVVRADRPMASALALTPVEGSDGMLTSLELLDLRVPADLVVLSACDTARGEVYDVEGVVGLTRAFMFAGSPRVLASLWKVDDEATRALMTRFYELWNPSARGEGLGAAAALRQAQAWLRGHERWAHPYYWAAWVLWGLPE